MLSGFDGSPGGLGLMDATSKVVAVVEAAVDDEGCCADTAVAASRAAKANALIERILFMVNLPAFSKTFVVSGFSRTVISTRSGYCPHATLYLPAIETPVAVISRCAAAPSHGASTSTLSFDSGVPDWTA
jgi:hypothetical protein